MQVSCGRHGHKCTGIIIGACTNAAAGCTCRPQQGCAVKEPCQGHALTYSAPSRIGWPTTNATPMAGAAVQGAGP